MLRVLITFLLLLSYFSSSYSEESELRKQPKLVFAHYMVCCPAAGGDATVADFELEIKEAQSRGIDGFSLNVGGWMSYQPVYKERALKIYEAARRLNSNFKIFLSLDGKALNDFADVVKTVSVLPAQLFVDGRPVVSTFGGEGPLGFRGHELIDEAKSLNAFFVPYFFPRPRAVETPRELEANLLGARYSQLDGFFYFGAAGDARSIAASNLALGRVWKDRAKVFMASVTPYYIGGGVNFRAFETRGYSGMALEWEAAIAADATWVQIVSWNDWYESTYIAPFNSDRRVKSARDLPSSRLTSHAGYLEASSYYIKWFKTGVVPKIDGDKLFYFYRLHPKSEMSDVSVEAADGRGFPKGVESLDDSIFVTAFLTAGAVLEIHSGGEVKVFRLGPGVNHVDSKFFLGRPRFILRRGDDILIDKVGEKGINLDSATRFNYFSGSAVAN